MLDNNVAIIKTWYSNKPDLLPQNTVKAVEISQNDVYTQSGGAEFYHKNAYSNVESGYTLVDEFTTGLTASWSQCVVYGSNSFDNKNLDNGVCAKGTQILGKLVAKIENTFNGDDNPENYSISQAETVLYRHPYAPMSGYFSTLDPYGGILGSMDTDLPYSKNFVQPVITIEGNYIVLTFDNVYLTGSVYLGSLNKVTGEIVYNIDNQPYKVWSHKFDLNYGGIKVRDYFVQYGNPEEESPYEITKNGFVEKNATFTYYAEEEIDGEIAVVPTTRELGEEIATSIIENWSDGRQYLEVETLCTIFYNESGEELINPLSDKPIFTKYDRIVLKNTNGYVYKNEFGEPKIFVVLSVNYKYNGRNTVLLKCIEEKL